MSDIRWSLKWHQKNRLDGFREWLMWGDCMPLLFRYRREARKFALEKFGYIKTRKDLRIEPHGWRMPIPVKVRVIEVK